ncbi:MAG: hypothetical protein JWM97_817 [Phycisphaerales bacterium]|nr:hypothetical protein [Phycisphaerales bacterium]
MLRKICRSRFGSPIGGLRKWQPAPDCGSVGKSALTAEPLERRLLFSLAVPAPDAPTSGSALPSAGEIHVPADLASPASLTSTVVGDGTAQRSLFNSFTLVFSQVANLAPGAVTMKQVTTSSSGTILSAAPVAASAFTITNPSADGITWVVKLAAGGAMDNGRGDFKDGVYQFTLHAALITSGGAALDGGDQTQTFRKLFGDASGDGRVNSLDYLRFASAFGTTTADAGFRGYLDFNHDLRINPLDYLQFTKNFGSALFLPVNHAPSGTNHTVTTLENSAYAFTPADFGFSDPQDPVPNNLRAVEISGVPVSGSLTDNGAPVAPGQFIPVTDIAGGGLIFTPSPYDSGTGYATFAFQVQDDGGVANGGVDLDPTPRTMTVNVTPTVPPNNNLVNAIVLAGSSVTTAASNVLATKEPLEPNHANNSGGASVWWTWIAPASGYVTISTAGSALDTLLAAYRGSRNLASLIRVASNDDDPGGAVTSLIRFKAISGTTYYIAVDGYNGATGTIALSLTLSTTTYTGLASRASETGQWFVAKSNGSAFTTSLWETWDSQINWVDAVNGDFNGDGRTDIAARNAATGEWSVAVSSGSGFTTSVWETWAPGVNWVDVRVGDFNGDGRDDIAGRNSATGEWSVALSKGAKFSTGVWATWSPAVNWSDVQVGDFNNDGRSDIAGRNVATGQWWVASSTGVGLTNGLWDTWSPSVTWADVRVGDFNGDGRSDIAGRNAVNGQWWVASSNGIAFSTSLWTTWSSTVNWSNVRVGDFNGDGRSDIVGRNSATGQWFAGVSTGTVFNTTLWGTWNPAVNWSDVQVGDFNGDGRDDLTGRDSAGQVWVAISSGTGFQTTLWDAWSSSVTWTDTKAGTFVG